MCLDLAIKFWSWKGNLVEVYLEKPSRVTGGQIGSSHMLGKQVVVGCELPIPWHDVV